MKDHHKESLSHEEALKKAAEEYEKQTGIKPNKEMLLKDKIFAKLYSDHKKITNLVVESSNFKDYFSLHNLNLWDTIIDYLNAPQQISIDSLMPSQGFSNEPIFEDKEDLLELKKRTEEENFDKMLSLAINLDLPTYDTCFIEFLSFLNNSNDIEKDKLRRYLYNDNFLDDLQERYINKYGYDDFDIISLVGFQLYKKG